MTIDERLERIAQNLDDRENRERFKQLTENIRAVARIAELHKHRLDNLEEQ